MSHGTPMFVSTLFACLLRQFPRFYSLPNIGFLLFGVAGVPYWFFWLALEGLTAVSTGELSAWVWMGGGWGQAEP